MNIKNVNPVCPNCGGMADCDTINYVTRVVCCEYCLTTYNLDWIMGILKMSNVYQEISDTLNEWVGVHIPVDKLEVIYQKETELLASIEKWGMDTLERDSTLDVMCRYFVNRNWPTYGEGVDMNMFLSKFVDSVKEKGFFDESN